MSLKMMMKRSNKTAKEINMLISLQTSIVAFSMHEYQYEALKINYYVKLLITDNFIDQF